MSPKALFVTLSISTDSSKELSTVNTSDPTSVSHESVISRKLFEHVPFAVLEGDGRVIFSNSAMASLLDLSIEELNGSRFRIPRRGFAFFETDADKSSLADRSWKGPVQISTPERGEHYIEATVSDLLDDQVISNRFLAIHRGSQLESDALSENRDTLSKKLLRKLPDAVFVMSNRKVIYGNSAAIQLLDAGSIESLVGKDAIELFPKQNHSDIESRLDTIENDFVILPPLTVDVVGRYGLHIPSTVQFFSFENQGELLTAFTIRPKAGFENTPCVECRNEFDCEKIVAELPVSYFQIDEFGRLQDWNKRYREELKDFDGTTPGSSIFEMIHENDRSRAVRHFATTIRRNFDETEISVRSKSGKVSRFQVRSFRLDTAECRAIACIAFDISWKLEIEDRLIYERDYASAVLNCLPGVFYHYDSNMKLVRWNENHEKITGYNPDELNGSDPLQFIAEDMRELVSNRIQEVFQNGSAHVEADYLLKTGERVPYLFTAVSFEHKGSVGFVGTGTDISGLKDLELSLVKQTALFKAQVESSHSGILVTDVSGNRLIQNQNFNEMWNIPQALAETEASEDLLKLVASRTPVPEEFIARVEWLSTNPELFSNEEIELNDGRVIERYSGPVLGPDGAYYGRNWIHRDITKRKRFERKIRYLATHDALTTLSNRTAAQEKIETSIAVCELTKSRFAVLFLDLDRFKIINDGFGHPFGDAVLKETAARLKKLVRKKDVIARYGGDEFLLVLTNIDSDDDACEVAQSIVNSLEQPIVVHDRELFISGSIGISMFPNDGKSAEELIDRANLAMYRAKELGRSNCQVFTTQLSNEVQRAVSIETNLRKAIDADLLNLVYQPKVSLITGKITGCEALVRWKDDALGIVSPGEFIPIAEDSGLIVPLGDWVLLKACRQAMDWRARGMPDICVAVNVSNRQFLQYDVFDWVMETLEATGMPPELLEIELTERIISQDVQKALNDVNLLREVGVKFSIDDFGTGYSSLSYLSQFRMDTLKIDQAFVRNMLTNVQDANIVKTIITMAHNLGFRAIAEGVETEAQCEMLAQLECDEIQGYYFSCPVEAEELEQMVKSHRMISTNHT